MAPEPQSIQTGALSRAPKRLLSAARLAPTAAALVAGALAAPAQASTAAFAIFVALVVAFATSTVAKKAPPHGLLPLVAQVMLIVPAIVVGIVLTVAGLSGAIPGVDAATVLTVMFATALGAAASGVAELLTETPRKRVVVVGCALEADNLARELHGADCTDYEVVGFVDVGHVGDRAPGHRLGTLEELGTIVAEHDPDLLLLSSSAPRLDVFRILSQSLLGSRVRVLELTAFYESTLGHVPIGAINDAWFQCVMHPNWAQTSRVGRFCDVAIAATVGVLAAPLMLILAALIRRDGGPVLYRQVRIGEGGRPFEMLKLRSMRVDAAEDAEARWSSQEDSRVTGVGHFMRKCHLDEIPQIVNVLRGEMSIVGPRPEQPEFVAHLEGTIPFYARRHLTRPGVTGWAQIHCGYAGSESGSAWKLSHDLYYLRHRSAVLDLMILCETLRTLFADRQYARTPGALSFVVPEESAAIGEVS